jgi:hypothetical protein
MWLAGDAAHFKFRTATDKPNLRIEFLAKILADEPVSRILSPAAPQ